jgi:hypothetical protein
MGILNLFALWTSLAAAAGAGEELRLQKALCPFNQKAAEAIFHKDAHDGITADEVKEAFRQLTTFYGKCESIRTAGPGSFLIRFRDADLPLMATFGRNRRVLRFEPGQLSFRNDSWEKITAFARQHLHHASLHLERDGRSVAGLEPDKPLNVSRSAQVFLLKAVHQKVKEKALKWTDLVRLDADTQSVSFGLLHSWVQGTHLTLDSLRNFVMIENDATAADLLLKAVGRDAVEKQGKNLAPFLSHRELALLMGAEAGELDGVERKGLPRLAARLGEGGGVPDFPDERFDLIGNVGWFASTKELCVALIAVRDDPALRISARSLGEAERLGGEWGRVVALQARDPGIAQATVAFEPRSGGKPYCFALTVNRAEPFDEMAFSDLTVRIYELILKEELRKKNGN